MNVVYYKSKVAEKSEAEYNTGITEEVEKEPQEGREKSESKNFEKGKGGISLFIPHLNSLTLRRGGCTRRLESEGAPHTQGRHLSRSRKLGDILINIASIWANVGLRRIKASFLHCSAGQLVIVSSMISMDKSALQSVYKFVMMSFTVEWLAWSAWSAGG